MTVSLHNVKVCGYILAVDNFPIQPDRLTRVRLAPDHREYSRDRPGHLLNACFAVVKVRSVPELVF